MKRARYLVEMDSMLAELLKNTGQMTIVEKTIVEDKPHLCSDCHGTGIDQTKTAKMKAKGGGNGHIRCHACNGNGLDPAEYFDWSNKNNSNNAKKD